MIAEVLRAMRPHQWVKNLFVLVPLVFAERALVVEDLLRASLAFVLFCAVSGCVYILNDIVDVEADRRHPTKRHRPIASGELPLQVARRVLAVILLASIGASFALSTGFATVTLAYFALNVGYSLSLKHFPWIDVCAIAGGFVLRILGGGEAVDVPVTSWTIGITILLALYLGLGKRKHELLQAGQGATEQRRVLSRYRLTQLRAAMAVVALGTALTYTAYTVFGEHIGRLAPEMLAWTLPCVVLGLLRFNQLTNRTQQGRSPTDLMLSDALFLANLALWGIIVIILIYLL